VLLLMCRKSEDTALGSRPMARHWHKISRNRSADSEGKMRSTKTKEHRQRQRKEHTHSHISQNIFLLSEESFCVHVVVVTVFF